MAIHYDWDPGSGIDLRHLGESLLGIERIVSVGLFGVENGRFPRGREQSPFAIRVTGAQPGSIELETVMHVGEVLGLFALIQEETRSVLSSWVMWVLNRVAGRDNEAAVRFDRFLEFLRLVERNRHREALAITRAIENMDIERLRSFARDAVSPVGRSCSGIGLSEFRGTTDREIIDESLAREIRRESRIYTGQDAMTVRVDGFSHHDRRLRIEDPEEPGRFISAEIVDPDFSELSNIYLEAAARREYLTIVADVTYRARRIVKLCILSANGPFKEIPK
ncbi:MAG: hypothetical protein OXU42_09840 [Deltaproteobacteria bacterium]|nr:hypothetical protein [Deltaproteobacteria bacterium]